MTNLVHLMIACNNPDNGIHQGYAEAFCFEVPDDFMPVLNLEGGRVAVRLKGDQLHISRRAFPVQNYATWVGNWCWDCATVDTFTAVQIANYLHGMKKFDCIEGWEAAFDTWKMGLPITAAMFENDYPTSPY